MVGVLLLRAGTIVYWKISKKHFKFFSPSPYAWTVWFMNIYYQMWLMNIHPRMRKETVFMRRAENKTAGISTVQHLRSHGYPETCCQSYAYAILSDDLLPGDCVHLYFEDLDLPLNASLSVLEVVENSSSVLFQYTSGKQDNVFLCDSLKACRPNSSLLVILMHQGNANLPFAGFSARLWSASVESSFSASGVQTYASASSVPCQVVTTWKPGQYIGQTIASFDKILDYVWVVRASDKACHLCDFVFAVLMIEAGFEGELEVRRGMHSDAFLVMQKSLKFSNESYIRFRLEAKFGLHIRLRVWPNITDASVAFVTGKWESSSTRFDVPMDTDSSSFLKWLLPLVGGFVLVGITFFIIKTYMKSKYRHHHHHNQCSNVDVIQPVHAVRLPLLHISNQVPSRSQPERSSVIFIPSRPHRQISFGDSLQSAGANSSSFPRTASIPIPMTRSAPIAIPVVVRPQVHRDGQVFPPSYEEVTAEHSCGNSSDGLDDLERLPEYHPPSYEDASQGEADIVSSWLSSTERPISD